MESIPYSGPSGPPRRHSRLVPAIVLLIAIAVGGIGFGAVHYRNQLVALDVAIDTQWKQVDNQLARQHELLPKLVTVTKQYASHETRIFESLIEARTHYRDTSERARPAVATGLDHAMFDVLALAEAYPDLKADRQFRDLSFEIAGSKNRIALERRRYNELVGLFNMRLRQLPWRLVALGLQPRPFYEFEPAQLEEPEVAF